MSFSTGKKEEEERKKERKKKKKNEIHTVWRKLSSVRPDAMDVGKGAAQHSRNGEEEEGEVDSEEDGDEGEEDGEDNEEDGEDEDEDDSEEEEVGKDEEEEGEVSSQASVGVRIEANPKLLGNLLSKGLKYKTASVAKANRSAVTRRTIRFIFWQVGRKDSEKKKTTSNVVFLIEKFSG